VRELVAGEDAAQHIYKLSTYICTSPHCVARAQLRIVMICIRRTASGHAQLPNLRVL